MPPLVLSWAEVVEDVQLNWIVYASMPLIAALVGYGTKIVAVQMLYHPVRFVGVGPIGWQGVIPRRAGKVASLTIQMLTERLLQPEEILARIDSREALDELRGPLTRIADEVALEVLETIRPGLWQSLPQWARTRFLSRIHELAPNIVDNLLDEVRSDLPRYVDLQYMAVTTLVRNKVQLNNLMQGLGGGATKFLRRSGIYFGLMLGSVQMVLWAFFQNPWIMPAFGFFIGFASDWVALNLIFVPRRPARVLGLFPFQGVLHADRAKVTEDYARLLAQDLFSPDMLLDAVVEGPAADKLWYAVEREVRRVLDTELGQIERVSSIAVGGERFTRVKGTAVRSVMKRVPQGFDDAKAYAGRALGLEELVKEKMNLLDDQEYESILRPIFKDDELLIISVGAVLGFLVGELQVLFIEHVSR